MIFLIGIIRCTIFFKWLMDYMIEHNQVDLFSNLVLQTEIPFVEGKTGHIGSKNILYYLVIKNYPKLVDQVLKTTKIDVRNLSYYHERYRLSSLFGYLIQWIDIKKFLKIIGC